MTEKVATFKCPECNRTTMQPERFDGQIACNSRHHLPRKIVPMKKIK